jgi:hypothetical protein
LITEVARKSVAVLTTEMDQQILTATASQTRKSGADAAAGASSRIEKLRCN